MGKLELCPMTESLSRAFWEGFQPDPAVYEDPNAQVPYTFSPEDADARYHRRLAKGKHLLAILLDGTVIGDIEFKRFEPQANRCAFGIHMKNDSFKNRGYGTEAERLALQYAFETLKVETVLADALRTNTRSRHVLEKVGFRLIRQDERLAYYACCRAWCGGTSYAAESWLQP